MLRSRLGVALVVAVVLLVGGAVALYVTPLLAVRTVDTSGVPEALTGQVASAVPLGTPLLRVDTGAAEAQIEQIPRVESATVERSLPSTVSITVVERVAVAFVDEADGTHLIDRNGVDFAVEAPPEGVIQLVTPTPGTDDRTTAAAVSVLAGLPEDLRQQVVRVDAPTDTAISLALADNRTLIWGSADDSEYKADVARALLTQPGGVYDISSPDLPTIR